MEFLPIEDGILVDTVQGMNLFAGEDPDEEDYYDPSYSALRGAMFFGHNFFRSFSGPGKTVSEFIQAAGNSKLENKGKVITIEAWF